MLAKYLVSSKLHPRTQLDDARSSGSVIGAKSHRVIDIRAQPRPIVSVQQIEKVSGELKPHFFRNSNALHHRNILTRKATTCHITQSISIAKRKGRRGCKRVDVEIRTRRITRIVIGTADIRANWHSWNPDRPNPLLRRD